MNEAVAIDAAEPSEKRHDGSVMKRRQAVPMMVVMGGNRALLGLDRCKVCGELVGQLADDGTWIHTPAVTDAHPVVPRMVARSVPGVTAHNEARLTSGSDGELVSPSCPKCSSPMQLRTSGKTGQRFWGCGRYPECRTTRGATAGDLKLLDERPEVSYELAHGLFGGLSDTAMGYVTVDDDEESSLDEVAPEGLGPIDLDELQDSEYQ